MSQHYEMESHGGTTFCAIAALQLSDQLDVLSASVKAKMIRWLLFRQVSQIHNSFYKFDLLIKFIIYDLLGGRF